MIPELGHLALVLALCVSLLQGVVPLAGSALGRPALLNVAVPAARLSAALLAFGFVCLMLSFAANDFTVAYVAGNSNLELPLVYRVAATWGAHEGSLHLWVLILAGWAAALSFTSRSLPAPVMARVLAVLGLVTFGFALLELTTSNPFLRVWPAPTDGRELNPLLQDPGLIIHPPLLYMGYVGFAIAFAFGIEGLLSQRVDTTWVRWARPWTNIAWAFLTLGIALGSWWAYYELGWGGWWFWDPVENASFMPWLVGAALVHSMAATEKRGLFRSWTVLLAILAFTLSLLGAFLVRSGVLTSVHAFAADPARGLFILVLLVLIAGSSLALYAVRVPALQSSASFAPASRETALLLNNLFWVACAGTVLVGTLYPLIIDALGLGKISVGPPYFNSVFVPLAAPLAVLVGAGTVARWKRDRLRLILLRLRWSLGFAIAGCALPALLYDEYLWQAGVGAALAGWVLGAIASALRRMRMGWLPRGEWGMHVAHSGMAAFIIGVSFVTAYGQERDLGMRFGEPVTLGGYEFTLQSVSERDGPNYSAIVGTVEVRADGALVGFLQPEKRTYVSQQSPLSEAGIMPGLTRDLYVSLGDRLDDQSWSLRVLVKPFVRWIWLGALLMAIGATLAATDRRYWHKRK